MAMQGDMLKHPAQRRVVVSSLYSYSMDIIDFDEYPKPKLVSRISKSIPKLNGDKDGSGNLSLFLDSENPYRIISIAISKKIFMRSIQTKDLTIRLHKKVAKF
jgi:hypothetical protein